MVSGEMPDSAMPSITSDAVALVTTILGVVEEEGGRLVFMLTEVPRDSQKILGTAFLG